MPRPMKFKQTDDVMPYVTDPTWVMQQKVDGIRAQLVLEMHAGGVGRAWCRASGGEALKSTTALPTANAVIDRIGPDGAPTDSIIVLDGEIVGNTWWLFDVASPSVVNHTFASRLADLELWGGILTSIEGLEILPTAVSEDDKMALLDRVYAENLEGVIVKRLGSVYQYDKRTSDSLKFKVTKTLDAVVMERDNRVGRTNSDGSALNASFGVYQPDGTLIEIGNCSMIGKPDAQPGDVIEVKYLYAGAGNRLVQPSCIQIRTDKTADECTVDQLVFTSKNVLKEI